VAGIAPQYLAAYGAALGLGGDLGEAMLPVDLSRRIVRRRRRSLVMSAIACGLALVFAVLSLDGFRSRTLRKLDAEISRVRERAEGALAIQRQSEMLRREAGEVESIETNRVDPLPPLAALSKRLPPEAYLQSLRSTGREWQIDGFARASAPLVASLEADPLFENVHFLTATSRTRVNGKAYESFSIAFRLVPAP
jgi:general secretion pathway protein L